MANELELAYDHCQRIAKEQAKNFYYAFRTLPSRKRRAIYAVYAFCRLCDDIADGELPDAEKQRRLALTRQQLWQTENAQDGGPVFVALRDAVESFSIPHRYFEEVVEGVEMDLTNARYLSFDDLRVYCNKVASVVGLICLEIFGYDDPRAREYATDLGIAMQLTNILRDIKEDAERNRIYLPAEELEEYGYTEAELFDGLVNDAFRQLMTSQCDRARRYFDSGERLIRLLPSDSRACLAVLHGVYSAILERIEDSGFNVFECRIGLSRPEKLFLMAKLWAGIVMPALPSLRR